MKRINKAFSVEWRKNYSISYRPTFPSCDPSWNDSRRRLDLFISISNLKNSFCFKTPLILKYRESGSFKTKKNICFKPVEKRLITS